MISPRLKRWFFQHFCFVICLVKKWKFGLKVDIFSTFCVFWKFCEFFWWFLKILFEFFLDFCEFLFIFFEFCRVLLIFLNFVGFCWFFFVFLRYFLQERYILAMFMEINCAMLFKKNKKVRSDSVIRFGWKYRKNLLLDVVLYF